MSRELTPEWNRGYRCHGYWVGNTRIGIVCIGPKGYWSLSDGYLWRMDSWDHRRKSNRAKDLKTAKKLIEKEYAKDTTHAD